jgi:hypothetical protein
MEYHSRQFQQPCVNLATPQLPLEALGRKHTRVSQF